MCYRCTVIFSKIPHTLWEKTKQDLFFKTAKSACHSSQAQECFLAVSLRRKHLPRINPCVWSTRVGLLTCQPTGTLQLAGAASWPWGCHVRSCPRRSTPPHELWAGGSWAYREDGQNSVLQHCCRSCQSGRYRCPPLLPCLWRPPFHSRHSSLKIEKLNGFLAWNMLCTVYVYNYA